MALSFRSLFASDISACIRFDLFTVGLYFLRWYISIILEQEFMQPGYVVCQVYRYDAASLRANGSGCAVGFLRETALIHNRILADLAQQL